MIDLRGLYEMFGGEAGGEPNMRQLSNGESLIFGSIARSHQNMKTSFGSRAKRSLEDEEMKKRKRDRERQTDRDRSR